MSPAPAKSKAPGAKRPQVPSKKAKPAKPVAGPKPVEPVYIIKRPILTEKSTYLSGEMKQYAFEVSPDASKTEIKQAIQQLYKVRVLGVNTQVRKGKFRRMRYGLTQEPTTKKATIRVHRDDVIELF